MIDLTSLKKGTKLKLDDGSVVVVSGLFLSSDGPVVMAKTNPSNAVSQNVPVSKIVEILKEE